MRKILIAAAAALTMLVSAVAGQASQPYGAAAFQEAQKAGKSVLLHVTAPWCSTCRAQHPVITSIEKARPGLVVYSIDFDTSKDTLRQLRVQYQSTLIMFKGTQEVGRSTGVTQAAAIEALVAKGF